MTRNLSLIDPRIWLIFCLSLPIQVLFAQRYDLRTYSVGEGLAQSQVFAMLEDHRGYLWMGTRGGGLSRFDGKSFETFTTREGLVNNYLLAVDEGPDGNLWIGTDNGISVYDGLRFKTLDFGDSVRRAVRAIETQGTSQWIGSSAGLYRYADSVLEVVPLGENGAELAIFSLMVEADTVWVGHANGLWQITPTDTLHWGRREGLRYGTLTAICRDSSQRLWAGTYGGGLYQLDGQRWLSLWDEQIPGEGRIFDLHVEDASSMWVATQDAGVIRLNLNDGTEEVKLDESTGLPSNHVHCLLEDRWGSLWLGTSGGGVSKYYGQQFSHQDDATGLPARAVYAVMEDLDCRLWIGAGSQGVAYQQGDRWILAADSSNFPRVKVKALFQDRNRRIWAGTEGQGLWWKGDSAWNQIDGTMGLGGNWIRDLAEDESGYLWVATAGGGLSRVNLVKDTTLDSLMGFVPQIRVYHRGPGMEQDRITCLYIDEQDRIWYGSQGQGLGYLDAKRQAHSFALPGPQGTNDIRCILPDPEGYLWLGTANGLMRFDPNAEDHTDNIISYRDRLTSSNIYLLNLDEYRHLWIGTEQGVDQAILDPDQQIIDVRHYGYAEGFMGVEACQDASLRDRDGNLWFGTVDGLTQYSPAPNVLNPEPPVLSMKEISLFYTPLSQTRYGDWVTSWGGLKEGLKLPHNQNNLSFDFEAVNLQNPEAVRYQWRLVGWEDQWSPMSQKSDATYSNLPPGTYTFWVKAANEDLVWNEKPLSLSFEILPPIWEEWWFLVGSGLLLGLVVIGFFQWRLGQVRKRAKEEQERLEMEKNLLEVEQKALRLQMNPHFIFNALSSIQGLIVEGKQQQARHQLARFARLMRKVLENSRQTRITLTQEIQMLEDYLKLEQFNRGDRFAYTLDLDSELHADEILIPPMLLQPFVENAVIHGVAPLPADRQGLIEIAFTGANEQLQISIRDNGVGREAASQRSDATRDQRKSTALAVIQERLALMSADGQQITPPTFIDHFHPDGKSAGTEVSLLIPLDLG